MPTLLRNSAAEGYRMGAGSHEAELNRTEAARQADLDRYQAIQSQKIKDMISSYDPAKASAYDEMMDTPNGKMSVRNFVITDPYQAQLQSAFSNRFQKQDARGNVSERGYTDIYTQDKTNDVNKNSGKKK